MTTTEISIDDLADAVGRTFGPTEWRTVDQATIDAFADATGDHQWIHVDPERAKDGPFGTTIAHGLLTLSLMPELLGQLLAVPDRSMGVNYGYNKVRFPAPVPVGSRLRATGELTDVDDKGRAVQTEITVTLELEDGDRPACVAQMVVQHVR